MFGIWLPGAGLLGVRIASILTAVSSTVPSVLNMATSAAWALFTYDSESLFLSRSHYGFKVAVLTPDVDFSRTALMSRTWMRMLPTKAHTLTARFKIPVVIVATT